MSVRGIIADKVTAGLVSTGHDPASFRVRTDYRVVDGLEAPTVLVRLESLTPDPPAWVTATVHLLVATPATEDEDELEAWLADVLAALSTDDAHGILWTTATRVVLDDTWPAWDITTTVTVHQIKE